MNIHDYGRYYEIRYCFFQNDKRPRYEYHYTHIAAQQIKSKKALLEAIQELIPKDFFHLSVNEIKNGVSINYILHISYSIPTWKVGNL